MTQQQLDQKISLLSEQIKSLNNTLLDTKSSLTKKEKAKEAINSLKKELKHLRRGLKLAQNLKNN